MRKICLLTMMVNKVIGRGGGYRRVSRCVKGRDGDTSAIVDSTFLKPISRMYFLRRE